MNNTLDGTDKEADFANIYKKYVDDIYRLCFSFMKNQMDAEDAVQETFLKYYRHDKSFDTEAHKKAWLIVTASNQCKDMLKHWWRQRKSRSGRGSWSWISCRHKSIRIFYTTP